MRTPLHLMLTILGSLTPLLMPTTRVLAADLYVCPVGCPYKTIQGAVNSAASGDVIHIGAGRYVENVKIIDKKLALIGESAATTEVDAHSGVDGPVFTLGSGVEGEYQLIEISGLTVAHGAHYGGGSGVGGGVQVQQGAYLHLYDSVVIGNSAYQGGGIGIATPGGPATTVTGCLIADNWVFETGAVGFRFGGGVAVGNDSSVVIQQSTITRNQAGFGGGVYTGLITPGAYTNSHLTLDHTTVSENAAEGAETRYGAVPGQGGGLFVTSNLSISDSVIADNVVTGPVSFPEGGGLFIAVVGKQAKQTISNTIIARNVADVAVNGADGGGILTLIYAEEPTTELVLDHVYVVENQAAPGQVGGIANSGVLILTHTTIADNSGFDCSGGTGCPP